MSEQLEAEKRARLSQQQKQGSEQETDVGGPLRKDKGAPAAAGGVAAMPKSDAVLNCPACMATLCLDCQR